jgi:hypothetical protein
MIYLRFSSTTASRYQANWGGASEGESGKQHWAITLAKLNDIGNACIRFKICFVIYACIYLYVIGWRLFFIDYFWFIHSFSISIFWFIRLYFYLFIDYNRWLQSLDGQARHYGGGTSSSTSTSFYVFYSSCINVCRNSTCTMNAYCVKILIYSNYHSNIWTGSKNFYWRWLYYLLVKSELKTYYCLANYGKWSSTKL